MDWLSEYVKAWSRHSIHFGLSVSPKQLASQAGMFQTALSPLNIVAPPKDLSDGFTLTLCIEDESLVYRFPYSCRSKERRGHLNERFLNPSPLLRVLDGLPEGTIILLPIPEIWTTEGLSFNVFLNKFDHFLSALPESFRYAIELHNSNYLLLDYFECLRQHNVAHMVHDSAIFTTNFGLVHNAGHLEIIRAVRKAVEEEKALYVYVDDLSAINHRWNN